MPPQGFAERVMRALPERTSQPAVDHASLRHARARAWVQRFAHAGRARRLAAGRGAAGSARRHEQRERAANSAGLAASRELMQALRVTSQKLDLAYQAVQSPPPADADEENRS